MAEHWDLTDKHRVPLGRTALRGEVFPKNEYHTIIHSWIRRKSDGRYLVSKRAEGIFWGGYWQPTGGSAVAGEASLAAAKRESLEELGVNLEGAAAFFLFSYRFEPPAADNNSFFLDAWLFELDDTPDAQNGSAAGDAGGSSGALGAEASGTLGIRIQPEEVADFAWLKLEEIYALWRSGAFMPFEQTWPPYFDLLKKALNRPQSVFAMRSWGEALLGQSASATPKLDSCVLLAHVLGYTKDALFARGEDSVDKRQISAYERLLYERLDGKAAAYLTGRKDFYLYSFAVDENVLIPKPDTELLVEKALELLEPRLQNGGGLRILDVCTGSGCVGISVFAQLAELCTRRAHGGNSTEQELKLPTLVLSDISAAALEIAEQNARSILGENCRNVSFVQGDLLQPFLEDSAAACDTPAPAHVEEADAQAASPAQNPRAQAEASARSAANAGAWAGKCSGLPNNAEVLPNEGWNGNAVSRTATDDAPNPALAEEADAQAASLAQNPRAQAQAPARSTKNEGACAGKHSGLPSNADTLPAEGWCGNAGSDPTTDDAPNPAPAEEAEAQAASPAQNLRAQAEPSARTAQTFDAVLANPPYVPSAVADELLADGRGEPRLALDGGADGLDLVRILVKQVWRALRKNGIFLIETGEYNAAQTRELLERAGFSNVVTFNDLSGQPRLTQAYKL